MKPKTIGIVGGAGPLAGAALLKKVLQYAKTLYGCYKDADFPKILLVSYPFSDMLSSQVDDTQIRRELNDCLRELCNSGASVVAVACNTLHAFLEEPKPPIFFVHLLRELIPEISKNEVPLVLCTSTSQRKQIHRRFFPCSYPNKEVQLQVDSIIDTILKGEDDTKISADLTALVEGEVQNTIILGCTELSIFASHLSQSDKKIMDPLAIAAKKILEKSFQYSPLFSEEPRA